MTVKTPSERWQVDTRLSLRRLRRYDRQRVKRGSWEALQAEITRFGDSGPERLSFQSISNSTNNLRDFIDRWLCKAVSDVGGSLIWGLYTFAISLLDEKPRDLRDVLQLLKCIFDKATIFNLALQAASDFTNDLKHICVDFALQVVSFLVEIIKEVDILHAPSTISQRLKPKHIATLSEVDSAYGTLGAYSERDMPVTLYGGSNHNSTGTRPRAAIPVIHDVSPNNEVNVPRIEYTTIDRQEQCFGRHAFIERIDEVFNGVSRQGHAVPLQRVVLHGVGGMGKSTIALLYATIHKQKGRNYDYLLIHSESPMVLKRSINSIAMDLKLPGAEKGDPDRNKAAVLELLATTNHPYVVIFDNANDPCLVNEYLPDSSRCHFIFTTRQKHFQFPTPDTLSDVAIEVGALGEEWRFRWFLYLLNVNNVAQLSEEETICAKKLAHEVGWHALTMKLLAAHMNGRKTGITVLHKVYQEDYQHKRRNDIKDDSGNLIIETVSTLSFKSLDHWSLVLLGLMSYLEPDNIPQEIFEPSSTTELSASLRDVIGEERLSFAMQPLIDKELVHSNKSSTATFYSLHRVVQESFKTYMTPEKKKEAFNNATILVSSAFPRHDSTEAQLYGQWDKCIPYVAHVLYLAGAFDKDASLRPLRTFCEMNNACQRYLLEKYLTEECESLIETNLRAIKLLSQHPLNSLLGNAISHKGQILAKTGRRQEGIDFLKESYAYFYEESPRNEQECGWAAGNAGDALHTFNNGDLALQWQEKALSHFDKWSSRPPDYRFRYPAALLVGYAVTLAWNGEHARAREEMMKADEQVKTELPGDWAISAFIRFTLATISWLQNKLDESAQLLAETIGKWSEGDQSSHPIIGACLYRLGCISSAQGKTQTAIDYLRQAVAATTQNKKHMKGEYMRCIFKLSVVLIEAERCKDPPYDGEGLRLRTEAKHLLFEHFPLNKEDPDLEETYDRLVCISWR